MAKEAGSWIDPSCPLDWRSPLLPVAGGSGDVYVYHDWTVLPHLRQGRVWRDLNLGGHRTNNGTFTSFNFDANDGWRGESHPGGYGSILFKGAAGQCINSFPVQFSDANSSRTIVAWIKPASTSRMGIIGTRSSTGNGFVLTANRTTAGNLTYFHTGGGLIELAAGLSVGVWSCVGVVIDKGTNVARLYCNGVSLGSVSSFGAETSSSFNGVIGDEDQTLATPFNGKIASVRIWNHRILTPAEMMQVYLESKAGRPETLNWVGGKSRVDIYPTNGGTTRTATISASAGPATAAFVASFTKPTYTATIVASAAPTTASFTATFTKPTYTATIVATTGAATAAFAATFTQPVYTASITAVAAPATASFSATFTKPTYTAVIAATTGPATASFTATYQTVGAATIAATVGATVASFSATFVKPTYTAAIAATAGATTASFSAVFASSVSIAVITAITGAASAQFVASFTPAAPSSYPVIAFTIYFAYAQTSTIEFAAVQSSELSMQYVHASTEQFAEI